MYKFSKYAPVAVWMLSFTGYIIHMVGIDNLFNMLAWEIALIAIVFFMPILNVLHMNYLLDIKDDEDYWRDFDNFRLSAECDPVFVPEPAKKRIPVRTPLEDIFMSLKQLIDKVF